MLVDLAEMGRDMAFPNNEGMAVKPFAIWNGRKVECVPSSAGVGSTIVLGGQLYDVALTLVVPRSEFLTVDSEVVTVDQEPPTVDDDFPIAGNDILFEEREYKILTVTHSAFKGSVSLRLGDIDR